MYVMIWQNDRLNTSYVNMYNNAISLPIIYHIYIYCVLTETNLITSQITTVADLHTTVNY